MNPLTNTRNITKLSQRELQYNDKTSWHDEYKDSAWIFVGGLPYDLSEGDVIAIFSQYGEIVNINCVRDKVTGKFKGFGFICYEDQRSTILAVDNFNGIKVLGRTIRVDHVKDYKPPKDSDKYDDVTRQLMSQGCAPEVSVPQEEEEEDFLLPLPKEEVKKIKVEPSSDRKPRDRDRDESEKSKRSKKSKSKKSKHRKEKKHRRERTKKSKKRRSSSSSDNSNSDSSDSESNSEDDSRRRKRRR